MKKQTAVEWLASKLNIVWEEKIIDLVEEAKEMEKEQIIESYCKGCFDITQDEDIFPRETSEQYYKETYETQTN